MPLRLSKEKTRKKGFPSWHDLPTAFPEWDCQRGWRVERQQVLNSRGRPSGRQLLTQGGCGGCLEPFVLWVQHEPYSIP